MVLFISSKKSSFQKVTFFKGFGLDHFGKNVKTFISCLSSIKRKLKVGVSFSKYILWNFFHIP